MLEIRNFTKDHIDAALRLCNQVGWNHLSADWQRCIDLNPEGCIGGFINGELMATTTVNRFQDFGWVGTFLVDESLRGKGYGKQMFEAVIAYAQGQGIKHLGLDSTDAGRPIYLKYGFVLSDVGNEMWSGLNGGPDDPDCAPLSEVHLNEVLALDRKRTGIDRFAQLRHLFSEPGAAGRVLVRQGQIIAFGFSRPGRLAGGIGPVVANHASHAMKVITALCAARREIDGDRAITLAVLDNDSLKLALKNNGFQMRRRLIRMFRPERQTLVPPGTGAYISTGLGMG